MQIRWGRCYSSSFSVINGVTRTKKHPDKPVKTGIYLAGIILVKACKSMGIKAVFLA